MGAFFLVVYLVGYSGFSFHLCFACFLSLFPPCSGEAHSTTRPRQLAVGHTHTRAREQYHCYIPSPLGYLGMITKAQFLFFWQTRTNNLTGLGTPAARLTNTVYKHHMQLPFNPLKQSRVCQR